MHGGHACLLTNRVEMNDGYRGLASIDASYQQVSVHLAQRFQRRMNRKFIGIIYGRSSIEIAYFVASYN
jgi:tetrahydromethanopterin S-methyltransferase subunit G